MTNLVFFWILDVHSVKNDAWGLHPLLPQLTRPLRRGRGGEALLFDRGEQYPSSSLCILNPGGGIFHPFPFSTFQVKQFSHLKRRSSGWHSSGTARSEPSVRKLPPPAPLHSEYCGSREPAKGAGTAAERVLKTRGVPPPSPSSALPPPHPCCPPLPVRGPAAPPAVWFLNLLERIRREFIGEDSPLPASRITQEGSFIANPLTLCLPGPLPRTPPAKFLRPCSLI